MNTTTFSNPLVFVLQNSPQDPPRFAPHGSLASHLISNVNQASSSIEETQNTRKIYSPTFQCFTGLPFYAAIVRELKFLARIVDDGPPIHREMVWAQLFAIVGATHTYDGSFSPVLTDTFKQPNVSLLDLEVLFLSFFLIAKIFPSVLGNSNANAAYPSGIVLRQTLKQNVIDFFVCLRKYHPCFLGTQSNLMAARTESPAPFQATHWSGGNLAPSSLLQRGGLNLLDIVEQTMMLQEWAPHIDQLPNEVKESVWEHCKSYPEMSNLTSLPSLTPLMIEWASDWSKHEQSIRSLYRFILQMYEKGTLKQRFFSPQFVSERLRELSRTPSPSPALSPSPLKTILPVTERIPSSISPIRLRPPIAIANQNLPKISPTRPNSAFTFLKRKYSDMQPQPSPEEMIKPKKNFTTEPKQSEKEATEESISIHLNNDKSTEDAPSVKPLIYRVND